MRLKLRFSVDRADMTYSISPLLVRPDPHPDESPMGYLLRLIDVNGLLSASHFRDVTAVPGQRLPALWTIATWDQYMRMLATATGKETDKLLPMVYQASKNSRERTFSYQGVPLPRWALRFKSPAVCPACLRESPYARAIWDVSLVGGCDKHHVHLIGDCPACKKPLTWSRTEVAHCGNCGFDLRMSERSPLTSLESDREQWIAAVVGGFQDCLVVAGQQVSISAWMTLFTFVWRLQADDINLNASQLAGPDAVRDIRSKISHTVDVLRDWSRFDDLVRTHLKRMAAHVPALGIRAWAQPIHEYLSTRPFRDAELNFVRTAFERICGSFGSSSSLQSMVETEVGRCNTMPLSLDQVADVLALPGGIFRSRTAVDAMKALGCLVEGRAEVNPMALDALLQRIRESVFPRATRRTVSVGQLVLGGFLSRASKSIWELMGLLKSGEMRGVAWPAMQPLAHLELAREDLDDFLGQGTGNDGFLTIPEAAARLKTYPQALYLQIHAGRLRTKKRVLRLRSAQWCISEEDLAVFLDTYITAGMLAREFEVGPTNMADKIRHAGVEPVSGPHIDGSLIYLFKRADLQHLDLGRVARSKYVSRSGRKKRDLNEPKIAQSNTVESTSVALRLGISFQQLNRLVKKGWIASLPRKEWPNNRRVFEKAAVNSYCAKYRENEDWVTVEAAAAQLNEPLQRFRRNWIKTGRLKAKTDGLAFYVGRDKLAVELTKQSEQVTARQAQELIGVARHTLANWQRLGRIAPVSGPNVDQCGTFMYFRKDVVALQRFLS